MALFRFTPTTFFGICEKDKDCGDIRLRAQNMNTIVDSIANTIERVYVMT